MARAIPACWSAGRCRSMRRSPISAAATPICRAQHDAHALGGQRRPLKRDPAAGQDGGHRVWRRARTARQRGRTQDAGWRRRDAAADGQDRQRRAARGGGPRSGRSRRDTARTPVTAPRRPTRSCSAPRSGPCPAVGDGGGDADLLELVGKVGGDQQPQRAGSSAASIEGSAPPSEARISARVSTGVSCRTCMP